MSIELLTPYLEKGIRHSHFFNGRLLTAEALETEQIANLKQRRLLGQAVGAGIAHGLEVSFMQPGDPPTPTVLVKSGLAVTTQGDTVHLTQDVQLALVAETDRNTPINGAFTVCRPVTDQLHYTGAGIYLLVMAPATAPSDEQTPSQGFPTGSSVLSSSYCNFRDTVLGVQFRLVHLDVGNPDLVGEEMSETLLENMGSLTETRRSKLRNLIAHLFLGGDITTPFAINPFERSDAASAYSSYGLLDTLRAFSGDSGLQACDVPLAVLYWDQNGIVYVDMWTVRRRLVPPSALTISPSMNSERFQIEAEARSMQFQDHLEHLRVAANSVSLRAAEHYRYLPPVGMVPLQRHVPSNPAFMKGFHPQIFFDSIPHHPIVHIEGSRLPALMQAARHYPPLEIASGVMLWIYRVVENQMAGGGSTVLDRRQPYLVFTTGHMAYMGDPHYDVNRWDYSNYA